MAHPGKLLNLGASVQSMPNIRIGNAAVSRSLSALLSIESSSAVVQSVPAERDVLCASWLSHSQLLLGLSAGDVLLVTIDPQGGHLKEQYLKDIRGNLVQHWWSELMGDSSPSFNFDTIHVASLGPCSGLQSTGSRAMHHYACGLAVAVNRCGELRAWNTLRRQLVLHSSVFELLSAVGGLEQFYRSGGGEWVTGGGGGSSSVGRSIASNRKSVNLDGNQSSHQLLPMYPYYCCFLLRPSLSMLQHACYDSVWMRLKTVLTCLAHWRYQRSMRASTQEV
jgi:hypothetical protein